MTHVMTPSSPITQGQIGKMNETLAARCRKNEGSLPSHLVQEVLHEEGDALAEEQFLALRARVERRASIIWRQVRVDRTLTPAQVIDRTGRVRWYVDEEVLAEMPREGLAEDRVGFFDLDYDATPDQLDQEYERRGMKPDLYAVAQAMADDPAFADERPVAVQWRDAKGRACYAIFRRWSGKRRVGVGRFDGRWPRGFRFGGARK